MFYRKNDYLSMVGMLKGENVFTYPPYDHTQAVELIEQAREVAPFVIIDCGSTIASDVLSAVALMEADTVLRLVNCDLKSIFKSRKCLFAHYSGTACVSAGCFICNSLGNHDLLQGNPEGR